MAKEKIEASVLVETAKDNKATKVIQLRTDDPSMSNVNVAKSVGCSQTYSSKIWSDYTKGTNSGMKTSKEKVVKTSRKRKSTSTAKAPKITAKRKATTTSTLSATPNAEQILTAYDDMKCLVNRVGSCAAAHLLKRVESELS